jgi:hypothetical protein
MLLEELMLDKSVAALDMGNRLGILDCHPCLTSFKRHKTSKRVPPQRISRNLALETMWALS